MKKEGLIVSIFGTSLKENVLYNFYYLIFSIYIAVCMIFFLCSASINSLSLFVFPLS